MHCISVSGSFKTVTMTSSQSDLFTFGPFGKKPLKEQVTPHKISLVVLIQEYCSLKEEDSSRPDSLSFASEKPAVKITEREKRNFMVTILQLLQVRVSVFQIIWVFSDSSRIFFLIFFPLKKSCYMYFHYT